jgi:hypothetical protein
MMQNARSSSLVTSLVGNLTSSVRIPATSLRQPEVKQRKHPEQPLTNSISVDSIDKYAAKITEAGGQIVVPKMAIPSAGYLAYFKDTEGNIHGLWQEDTSAA